MVADDFGLFLLNTVSCIDTNTSNAVFLTFSN